MEASEALRRLNKTILVCPRCTSGMCDECQLRMVMYDALKEKAEREEAAKPKVTLNQQINAITLMRRDIETGLVPRAPPGSGTAARLVLELKAAAETLRRLEKEPRDLMRKHNYTSIPAGPGLIDPEGFAFACARFFCSIGVLP